MLKAGVLAEPVLVGREHELEELTRYLDSVFEGKGTIIFLSGEAGTGKTRIVRKFLDKVKGKGVNVLSGWCLSDFAVPYLPFKEAFNEYFKAKKTKNQESATIKAPGVRKDPVGDEEAEIKAWLTGPSQSERLQNLTPQGWQDLAVAAITKALVAISEKKPTILFIDDLHWADSASLSLLHYIARSISSARILVLATYRSEELGPDTEGHTHPLLETLRMMRRENVLKEIKLSSLAPAHVVTLAEKMVGGGLHEELSDRLFVESQGNPLFVVESLRMLSERGSLVQDNGRWGISTDEIGIPAKIKDIILRRVDMLKPSQQRMLQVASVIGEKFDVELLGAVLGQDSLHVLEALNAITQSSSLLCCEGSYYEFDHARSREAIYNSLSAPLRRGYHAKIAEKLEVPSIDAEGPPFNDLAYHYAQAGNKEKAVKYALAAGEDALTRFSNSEAEKHYRYVLDAVSESSEQLNARTAALEGLGDALNASDFFNEAVKEFERLSRIAISGALKLRALRKAFLCSYWLGDWTHARELAAKAEEYAQFDRLEYARLRLYRGFMAGREVKTREAVKDVEWALGVFEEEFSLRDVAAALAELVFIQFWAVPIEVRVAAALRSVALFKDLEDLRGQVLAHNRLGWVFARAQLFKEAKDSDEKGLEIGEKVGEYNIMALTLWGRGMNLLYTSRIGEALVASLKAAEYAERTNAYYTQSICYQELVREYAQLGKIEHAEEYAKKADILLNKVGSVDGVVKPADMALINWARIFLAESRWREAAKLIEQVDAVWLKNRSSPLYALGLKEMYVVALEKQGKIREARVQLEEAKTLREKVREATEADRLPNRLEHAEIQPYFMALRETGVGEGLNLRLDLVNVGKNSARLMKVESLIPHGFKVAAMPPNYNAQNGSVAIYGKEVGSFTVETLKLSIQATKAGTFTLSPQVVYVDDLGEPKTCKPQPITITVHPMLHAKIGEKTVSVNVLPGRVTTGFADLDVLLFGGIPENYDVVLTGPPSDERAYLIKSFLEAGTKNDEVVFYVTTEADNIEHLLKNPNFHLFLCNPKPKTEVPDLPNVYRLRSKTDLTNLNISLVKAYRNFEPSTKKRILIETVSNILLNYEAKETCKWISELSTDLGSKGFTMLAVMDPSMHPPDQANAVINSFDGEISISQTEDALECKKSLRVKRLKNQEYLKNSACLKI